MQEQLTHWKHPRTKEPSFLGVVLLSALGLILILIISYFLIGGVGSSLVPGSHPRNAEPTSRIIAPVSGYNG